MCNQWRKKDVWHSPEIKHPDWWKYSNARGMVRIINIMNGNTISAEFARSNFESDCRNDGGVRKVTWNPRRVEQSALKRVKDGYTVAPVRCKHNIPEAGKVGAAVRWDGEVKPDEK